MGGSQSKSKLSKSELEFLKKTTKFSEDDIRKWHKDFISSCPSGHLTKNEFVRVYEGFFPGGDANAFCEHSFRTFDTNKSGYVDFKEFLQAISVMTHGSPQEKLEWAFHMYDIDASGTIEEEEMVKIMQAVHDMFKMNTGPISGPSDVSRRARTIFDGMDANNDKRLTFDEFMQGCLNDAELYRLLTSSSN